MRFQDKIVLISGGTRGIGKATALQFHQEGATLALIYKDNSDAAKQTLEEIKGRGQIYKCDVSDASDIQKTTKKVIKDFGRIDILVNNAAFHEYHPIDNTTYEDWQYQWKKTIEVNLMGYANLSYCVAQNMIQNKQGKIVYVSSRGAFRGEPEMPAYGASKAGINAMAQSLAQKLAPHNIHIGIVAPGFVETDLTRSVLDGKRGESIKSQSPMNRVAKTEEVAHAILFFADEKSVWSTGAILDINGASYLRT